MEEGREEEDGEKRRESEGGMEREEGGEVRRGMEGSVEQGGERRVSTLALGDVVLSEEVEEKAKEVKGGGGGCVQCRGVFFS